MPSEKLQVILELVTGQYKREALGAASATGKIGDSARGVTSKIGAMLGPAAIAGAVIGLGKMAVAAGENADRLFDLQAQTGLSTDALQEWEFVAKTAGAGTEVFSDAVKAVIKNLNDAEGATGAAGKAYETLGISVKDASGNLRDAGSITDEVFAKLAGMTNITERNALAQDIFGKKWEETISILDLGTDALQRAKDEAQGVIISEESLRGADEFRETWEKLKATLSAKLMETLGKLGPTLAEIADALMEVADAAGPLIDAVGDVGTTFSNAESGTVRFWSALFAGIPGLEDLAEEWDNNAEAQREAEKAARGAGTAYRGLGDAMTEMADASKDDVAALGDLEDAQLATADATEIHLNTLIALTTRLAAAINPAIAAHQAIQDLEQAHEDATDAAREFGRGSEEAAAAQLELALKTVVANDALARFGVNAESSVSAVADALNITDDQARALLDTLGILDGMTIEMELKLRQVNLIEKGVIPEGLGISPGTTTSTTTTRSGPRALGGPVRAGEMYMVGERGPEMFVSGQSGSIISNDVLKSLSRANTTINVASPTNNLAQDLQYAALLASVQTMVES